MNELQHHGIKGMRWGVRRSQQQLDREAGRKSKRSEDYQQARALRKKGVQNLSTAELKTLTNRMNLEKQFKDLKKNDISKGRAIAQSIIENSGKTAATTIVTAALLYGGKKLIAYKFGEDVVDMMFKKKK